MSSAFRNEWKRLRAQLEGHISPRLEEQDREELEREAINRTLDAMAHIRRAPIDNPRWRFDVEKLREESLFTIACYIAALSHNEHPDEERAREILEEEEAEREVEDTPLWTIISELERIFTQMREENEKREG